VIKLTVLQNSNSLISTAVLVFLWYQYRNQYP